VLLAVAGCGGGGENERDTVPILPPALAAALAARSDAVVERLEADDPCGARTEAEALQADTIAAVNEGRVPARYQEELGSAVASLVASIECAPAPPPPPVADGDDGGDEADDGKKGNGKGRVKGEGKDD
jgi:hypothetical protein